MGDTLVIQSYRTARVARWIERCMESVRSWAGMQGFAYEFIDDRLFDSVPGWYRERCGRQLLPVTDLARLLLIRQRLCDGWRRVAWIDADMLVFDPNRFSIEVATGGDYAFCREVWIYKDANGQPRYRYGVNNSATVMCQNAPALPFLIDASEKIVANTPQQKIDHIIVGTRLLSRLAQIMPVEQLTNVGMFSPPLMEEIAGGGTDLCRLFARSFQWPIAAANLCASLSNVSTAGACVSEEQIENVIRRMLNDRGEAINIHLMNDKQDGSK